MKTFLASATSFLAPLSVFATEGNQQTGGTEGEQGSFLNDNIQVLTINNPIGGGGINNLYDFIAALLDIFLTIGIPLVAIAIIYTGYLFVAAQGNSQKISEAKQALLWTVIGALILLGSWVIAQAIGGTINQLNNLN